MADQAKEEGKEKTGSRKRTRSEKSEGKDGDFEKNKEEEEEEEEEEPSSKRRKKNSDGPLPLEILQKAAIFERQRSDPPKQPDKKPQKKTTNLAGIKHENSKRKRKEPKLFNVVALTSLDKTLPVPSSAHEFLENHFWGTRIPRVKANLNTPAKGLPASNFLVTPKT